MSSFPILFIMFRLSYVTWSLCPMLSLFPISIILFVFPRRK